MVIKIYFKNKFIYRFKEKGFGYKRINIVDYYGIINEFDNENEITKYIIKNARGFDVSIKSVKYIKLKDNIYYMYIINNILKYKKSFYFDFTIPLNLLLWIYLEKNHFKDEFITFSIDNNILFQKTNNSYIYGLYYEDIIGNNIKIDPLSLIKVLKGELKNAIYV
ncbi:hypothetical protein [Marinitoga sp. 38H-ov]|uniref:hypothetical protein n=1 Tax=Marinitoga sp. 38H-ov TaxID=1755814 RepID=UPI0013EA4D71|nr:hypothetical protein [Marinitoga sp. 38H-ov]KAF2956735.1 hypothetical protein AS160_04000 [Marinitoga sp. 38H-ov]